MNKFISSIPVVLIVALSLAGCGGGQESTTPTITQSTTSLTPTTSPVGATSTIPPVSTSTNTSATTKPTTSSNSTTLPEVGVPITSHDTATLTAYKGLCQMCHGPGLANSNPYPPSWDGAKYGSALYKGVYTIVPGSVQDHTSYTVEQCTNPNCHAAGGATSTAAPVRTKFESKEPGGKADPLTFHPITGAYQNCVPCHYGPDSAGALVYVDITHPCEECHETVPMPSFDPGHNSTPGLPIQQACVICHHP